MNSDKINVYDELHTTMRQYFKDRNFTNDDFFCRHCGNLIIPLNILKLLRYGFKSSKSVSYTIYKIDENTNKRINIRVGDELYRWFIDGKYLSESNKTVYRHVCWNCFFDILPTVIDVPRRARKAKWYRQILNGEHPVPLTNIASSDYFKILFDITDDELKAEKVKLATASLEKFIRKHGEEKGKQLYDVYCKRQAYTASKEYFKETRGWTDELVDLFNMNRASTKKNFIKRYGELLGIEKWNKYCEYERDAGNTLKYFIEKYGDELGHRKYNEVCSKKVLSLRNFINKYGEELGKKKYSDFINKTPTKRYSEMSLNVFRELDGRLGEYSTNSRWATKNSELEVNVDLGNGINKCYFLDYELNGKVIEFNGDYWHANPAIYNDVEILNVRGVSILVKDIWKHDEIRLNNIKNAGYNIKIIWEQEWLNNPESVIEDCVKFLKS